MTTAEIPPPKKRPSRVTPKKLWERLSIPQSIALVSVAIAMGLFLHALPAVFWESLAAKMPMDTLAETVVAGLILLISVGRLYLGAPGVKPAAEPGDES